MSTEWLAIQSFQRSQDLLAAINTLSIHTKLTLSGLADEDRAEAAAEARRKVASFLEAFEKIVQQAEQAEEGILLGIDPRLQQLARSFVTAKRDRSRFHSTLFTQSPSETVDLLASADEKDQQAIVESLTDLRILVEEHIYTDARRILSEF
ncbi:MAG: hypothetical protein ACE5I2_05385 [Anaerolineae bacterium]